MFPSQFPQPHSGNQQGSMLAMAIFMIVVVGLLAAVLSEILSSSSTGMSYEILGVRAQAAASSGLEGGLYQVLRESQSCAQVTTDEDSLTTVLPVSLDTAQTGLAQCQVAVTCGQLPVLTGDNTTYFLVRSIATCSAGSFTVQRTMRTEVRK